MVDQRFPIFAKRFQYLRTKSQQSQEEFAKFLGISRPTVGFYENGSRLPDALILRQIAERCCVSSDWLIGLSNISELPKKSDFPIVESMSARFYKRESFLAEASSKLDLYALFHNLVDIFPDYIEKCVTTAICRCLWVLEHISDFQGEDSTILADDVIYFLNHGHFQDQYNKVSKQ